MEQIAFITGASSGFGRGMARRLAARGWGVALAARRVDRLEEVAAEVAAAGGRALVCPCDVGDRDQVRSAVVETVAKLGPVDLLLANAGVDWDTHATRLDGTEVEALMRINFLGVVYAAEAMLPSMIERGRGHLVGVGSLAGYGGLPHTAAYCASKAAVDKFLESLRLDLRGTGVDVTLLTPGYVKTEMTDSNPYPMPFLMELDDALDRFERAIDGRKRRVGFPFPLWVQVFLGQILPRRLYDAVASKQERDKTTGG